MAGKRKDFVVTPFAALKRVTVTGKTKNSPPTLPPSRPEVDGDELFLRAMAEVEPISPQKKKSPHHPSPPPTVRERGEAMDAGERREFLEAMTRMKLDVSFRDSIPSLRDPHPSRTRRNSRLDDLKKGKITIRYELDLHGLSREEAIHEIGPFIDSARRHGERAVLVITGKGVHSTEGPVLKRTIGSWLAHEGKGKVLEFAPAPPEMGGDGAVVVFLRKERSGSGQ